MASKSIEKISSVDVADLTAKPSEVSAPIETQKIETSVSSSISLPQTVEGVTFIDKDTKASLRSEDYELNLNVKKARNIEKKGIMGKPDPYVKVTYGNNAMKSKTIKNTYEPEWSYSTNLKITERSPDYLIIELFDEDIGKDDKLGNVSLDIQEIITKQSISDQWVTLSDCKSGEVLISYEIIPKKIVVDTEVIETLPSKDLIVAPSSKVEDLSQDDVKNKEFSISSTIPSSHPTERKLDDPETVSKQDHEMPKITQKKHFDDNEKLLGTSAPSGAKGVKDILINSPKNIETITSNYEIVMNIKKARNLQK